MSRRPWTKKENSTMIFMWEPNYSSISRIAQALNRSIEEVYLQKAEMEKAGIRLSPMPVVKTEDGGTSMRDQHSVVI